MAIALMASSCGGDGGATGTETPPKGSPEAMVVRVSELLAGARSEQDCAPLAPINGRSTQPLRCPPSPGLRRRLLGLVAVGAETHGTGAVVDYVSKGDGEATVMLARTADGRWGISHFGLYYGHGTGTSGRASRSGFADTVDDYLDAVRTRNCAAYVNTAVTSSEVPRVACRTDFRRTEPLARLLDDNPDARTRYLGGNRIYGFYALATRRPVPRYHTIGVARMPEGSAFPYRVVDAAEGPPPPDLPPARR